MNKVFSEFTLLLMLALLISGVVLNKAKGKLSKLALVLGLALYVSSFLEIKHFFFDMELIPRAIGFLVILFGTFPNVKEKRARIVLIISLIFMCLTLFENWPILIETTILKIRTLFKS